MPMDTYNVSRKVPTPVSAIQNGSLGDLSVTWRHGGEKFVSAVSDLSLNGAFIQTPVPPPPGMFLKLDFQVPGSSARARAVVRCSVPGEGMGVVFVAMEQKDRAVLALAAELAAELPPKPQPEPVTPSADPILDMAAEQPGKDRASAPSERRIHPRSKLVAQVQVTETSSGNRIGAGLGNVSAGGCFLELERNSSFDLGAALTIGITRGPESFQSEATVVYVLPHKGVGVTFNRTAREHLQLLVTWIMETLWLASDRRKSQRTFLSVPVTVLGNTVAGTSFSEETHTIKVSADGCSLLLAAPVARGQSVTVFNLRTEAMSECVVVRLEELSDGRHEVGMAFLLPNRQFWHMYFPPFDVLMQRRNAAQ
jgi:hypothetical protein